jgi:hypothetical protein
MLLVRVLAGHYAQGEASMRRPPVRREDVLFDSVVDNVKAPTIYITFDNTRSYPSYVVEYR